MIKIVESELGVELVAMNNSDVEPQLDSCAEAHLKQRPVCLASILCVLLIEPVALPLFRF